MSKQRSVYTMSINEKEFEPYLYRAVQQIALECVHSRPQYTLATILRYGLTYESRPDYPVMTYAQVARSLRVSEAKARDMCLAVVRTAYSRARSVYLDLDRQGNPRDVPCYYHALVFDLATIYARRNLRRQREAAAVEKHGRQIEQVWNDVGTWVVEGIREAWRAAIANGERFEVSASDLDRMVRPFGKGKEITE